MIRTEDLQQFFLQYISPLQGWNVGGQGSKEIRPLPTVLRHNITFGIFTKCEREEAAQVSNVVSAELWI